MIGIPDLPRQYHDRKRRVPYLSLPFPRAFHLHSRYFRRLPPNPRRRAKPVRIYDHHLQDYDICCKNRLSHGIQRNPSVYFLRQESEYIYSQSHVPYSMIDRQNFLMSSHLEKMNPTVHLRLLLIHQHHGTPHKNSLDGKLNNHSG